MSGKIRIPWYQLVVHEKAYVYYQDYNISLLLHKNHPTSCDSFKTHTVYNPWNEPLVGGDGVPLRCIAKLVRYPWEHLYIEAQYSALPDCIKYTIYATNPTNRRKFVPDTLKTFINDEHTEHRLDLC